MPDLSMEHSLPNILLRQDEIAGLKIPGALQASVDRHRDNLQILVLTLDRAGFCDSQIEAGVNSLIESYRIELTAALAALRDAPSYGLAA